jgi:hypothetical protein
MGGGLLGLLVLSGRSVEATHEPQGLVEEPRLTKFDVADPRTQAFVFKGWVDFPGTKGVVQIEVANNGNAHEHVSGYTMVHEINPSNTPFTTVGPQQRYRWTTESAIRIFDATRWPPGGTARVRFKAIYNHSDGTTSASFLQVRDSDNIPGNPGAKYLILSDTSPTPAQVRPIEFLGRKRPMDMNGQPFSPGELKAETDRYYKTVDTGLGPIHDAIPNLARFIEVYFNDCGGEEVSATYFNSGDLGLGREMHCNRNCYNELACYVTNFGAVDDRGRPEIKFGDKNAAFAAVKQHKPFATVAMVQRGWIHKDNPNRVLFVAYLHSAEDPGNNEAAGLAPEAILDNTQHNTFIPGNCLACHGISSEYDTSIHSVTGPAVFLPFDLQAFEFFSSDPTDPLSRARQEASFKALNRLVYTSDLVAETNDEGQPVRPWAKHLIERWYNNWTSATFINDQIPTQGGPGESWDTNDNTRQMYKKVVAVGCRTCHMSATTPLYSMDTWVRFKALGNTVYDDVCVAHIMPHAEQTSNVFWRSSGRSHLINRWPFFAGCGN